MKRLFLALFVALAIPISGISQNASPTPAPLSAEDKAFVDNGGKWIKKDTLAARSKDDSRELVHMALLNDNKAIARMVREGRAVVLKQGQRVQQQEVTTLLIKVRPVGDTKSWWIPVEHSSNTPVLTQEEKLEAVQATTPGVVQKPLTGNLSAVKLFLGQPLSAWKKAYPSPKLHSLLNPFAYDFNAGRFRITVSFDKESGLANEAFIAAPEGKAPITVKEATQIASSIGLSKPVKDPEDPSYLNWNNEGDPLFAMFGTDKNDRSLTITVKL